MTLDEMRAGSKPDERLWTHVNSARETCGVRHVFAVRLMSSEQAFRAGVALGAGALPSREPPTPLQPACAVEAGSDYWALEPVTERAKFEDERPWVPEMGEISGFGGGYEGACRLLVYEILWTLRLFDPKEELWQLQAAVQAVDACIDHADKLPWGGFTGAQVGAAKSHAHYAHRHGWKKYTAELIARERQQL